MSLAGGEAPNRAAALFGDTGQDDRTAGKKKSVLACVVSETGQSLRCSPVLQTPTRLEEQGPMAHYVRPQVPGPPAGRPVA